MFKPTIIGSPITLRPYQREARDAVLEEWERVPSTLLAMATGTGKTETFSAVLAKEYEAGRLNRAIVVAHRQELIYQPADRWERHWPQLPAHGIVMGSDHDDYDAPLVVATVQTLGRGYKRLQKVLSAGQVTHLVIDEAHHATAKTYQNVIKALQRHNPNIRILGVTATPKRSDEEALGQVFESVAYRVSIRDAIYKHKCLCEFDGRAVSLRSAVSLKNVPETAGDYQIGALGKVMSTANALELIVKAWRDNAEARPTIAFTPDVYSAVQVAAAFNAAGIPAAMASGETPKDERRQIIADYKSGKVKVLVNCALWTEGFDAPWTSCVMVLRPTQSDSLYIQMVGRGMRLHPGKSNCLILDFEPADSRNLRMHGDLLDGKGKRQRKLEEAAERSGIGISPNLMGYGLDASPDDLIVKALDYLVETHLPWYYDGVLMSCNIDAGTMITIVVPDQRRIDAANSMRQAGNWQDWFAEALERIQSYQVFVIDGRSARLLGMYATQQEATFAAEAYAEEAGAEVFAQKGKAWRKKPASDGQLSFLARLGVDKAERADLNRGQASQRITHEKARQILSERGVIRDAA